MRTPEAQLTAPSRRLRIYFRHKFHKSHSLLLHNRLFNEWSDLWLLLILYFSAHLPEHIHGGNTSSILTRTDAIRSLCGFESKFFYAISCSEWTPTLPKFLYSAILTPSHNLRFDPFRTNCEQSEIFHYEKNEAFPYFSIRLDENANQTRSVELRAVELEVIG